MNIFRSPVKLTALYLLLSAITPNNKLLFLLATCYVLALFITQRSIYKVLLYAFLPFSVTSSGLVYSFIAIPQTALQTTDPGLESGRLINYVFTPLRLITYCSFFYVLITYIKGLFMNKYNKTYSIIIFSFLAYTFLCIISSYYSAINSLFSMLFSFNELGLVSWNILFLLSCNKGERNMIKNIIYIAVIITIFEGTTVIIQSVLQRPIGLLFERGYLELSNTSDDINLYRPVGFRPFPAYLGYVYVEFSYIFVFALLYIKSKILKNLSIVGLLCSLLIISLSRSRSIYVAILPLCFVLVIYHKNLIHEIIRKTLSLLAKHKIFLLPFFGAVIGLVVILLLRGVYSINLFSNSGSVFGRSQIEKLTWAIAQKNLLLGVGTEMLIPAIYQQSPLSWIRFFPAPVHNGFLQILAENGLLALLFYLFTYISLIYLLIKMNVSKQEKIFFLSSFFTFFIIMLFNPIKLYIPIVFLLFLLKSNNINANKKI